MHSDLEICFCTTIFRLMTKWLIIGITIKQMEIYAEAEISLSELEGNKYTKKYVTVK
jgi:hypothetical protein